VGPHLLFVGGGGRLCPWALAVRRHALGCSRRWGVVASVGGRRVGGCSPQWGVVASMGTRVRGWASLWELFTSVGACCVRGRLRSWVGVVLVSGGLLRPWVLAFEGGHRVRGPSRLWGVVMGGFCRRGGFSCSSGGCRPWAVVLCGWGTVVRCG
jgi:hypothetical protein